MARPDRLADPAAPAGKEPTHSERPRQGRLAEGLPEGNFPEPCL